MAKKKIIRFLELNLNTTPTRAARLVPGKHKNWSGLDALLTVQRAAGDKKIDGLLLNASGLQAPASFLWELREVLVKFKESGKKVIAYFDNADMNLYCLLSAADAIVMDGAGGLTLLGAAWGRAFAKKTLKKIGVGYRELRYLEYKSAGETFSRTSLSKADRVQYGAYLDHTFNLTREAICAARNLTEENFQKILENNFTLSGAEALRLKLVDGLGREKAIKTAITGDENTEIIFKPSGSLSLLRSGKYRDYRPPKPRGRGKAEIAVINAKGATDLDEGMEARSLAKTIAEIAEMKAVKALVLRIDSPGGSAVAADYIGEAITKVREEMPVVVSMGEAAASGGYWASMFANHITASPFTLTGSIGVIAGWFFDAGLTGKLGLAADVMSRGEHADLLSGVLIPRRDLSAAEEEIFRKNILDLYGRFVEEAAKCRGKSVEELEPLARGRVYSGTEAVKAGLADSVGGVLDAIETARRLAEIPEKRKIIVREYPKPRFRDVLVARLLQAEACSPPAIDLLHALPGYSPELMKNLRFRLSHNGEALAILPLLL